MSAQTADAVAAAVLVATTSAAADAGASAAEGSDKKALQEQVRSCCRSFLYLSIHSV